MYKVRLQRDCSATVDSIAYLIAAESFQHASRTESVSEDKIGPQTFIGTNYVHVAVMTIISRHTAFLPTFREELEFDFAVDTLEHSDKSDAGLILSCSDDRLLSSYSESKLS